MPFCRALTRHALFEGRCGTSEMTLRRHVKLKWRRIRCLIMQHHMDSGGGIHILCQHSPLTILVGLANTLYRPWSRMAKSTDQIIANIVGDTELCIRHLSAFDPPSLRHSARYNRLKWGSSRVRPGRCIAALGPFKRQAL